jgi:hypothetical protein
VRERSPEGAVQTWSTKEITMTLRGLNLLAGLIAGTVMTVAACADGPEPSEEFTPSAAPSGFTAPVDPATSTSPPVPALPDAPPEIPPEGVGVPGEPIDPTASPPGG